MQASSAEFVINPLTHRSIRKGGTRFKELKRQGVFDSTNTQAADNNITTSSTTDNTHWSVKPIEDQQQEKYERSIMDTSSDDEEFQFNWDD